VLPSGEHVVNCQHVTMGCCTNLADFYRRVGSARHIRYYDRLYFQDARGRRGVIEPSALPPPLHLAPSFLLFPALSWLDKVGIARAMLAIVRARGRPADTEGTTMLEWLRRRGQTPGAIARFWRVVLVSALDEELDRTAARYGVEVFWKAFLASGRGFEVGIPSVPLGELYDGCRSAIEQRGGEVRTRAGVKEIHTDEGSVTGVMLDDDSTEEADYYVLAVPHTAVLALLPLSFIKRDAAIAGLHNLRASPITGVHLWFDRPVMSEPFLTLLDHTTQWIFNKTRLSEAGNGEGGQYLQLVISASYDLVLRSRQEIVDLCRRELADVLPRTRQAELVRATVIKEVEATFSPTPDADRWRPSQRTSLPNLFLAGDWTQTGWPATMEGAVRSGYLAGEAILAAEGRPAALLQPDLPVEGLARGFF
jgi:zeta-carotene desaturase